MISTSPTAPPPRRDGELERALDGAVQKYRDEGDGPELLRALDALVQGRNADELVAAAEPYRQVPEIAGPIYEHVVAEQPGNARALVALANAWWLTGRGPEVVGDLATRAIAADPASRGAWHLWCLSEGDPRARVARWRQVVTRFPEDDLARASLADNLASLAGAEHDLDALDGAIHEFEMLLERSAQPEQRASLEAALQSLRSWKL